MSSFGGHTVSKVGQYKVSLSDGKKFSVDSPSESPMENPFRKAVPLKDTIWAEGLLTGLFTVSFRVNDYAAFAAFGESLNRGTMCKNCAPLKSNTMLRFR